MPYDDTEKPLIQLNISENFFWNATTVVVGLITFIAVYMLVSEYVLKALEKKEQKEGEINHVNGYKSSNTPYADGIPANHGNK